MSLKQFKCDLEGTELKLESGQLAQQASGSIVATYGGTTVLATCVMGKQAKNIGYMPLTVDYEEKLYAAGKIKGSRFIKREGRASDEAILTGRAIDRCLRPLFDKRIRNDIQVILTVLSFDKKNDPDIPALVAASTALMVSDIPWNGPVSGARVGYLDGKMILNPTYEQREQSDIDLVVTGKDGKINMFEAGAKEISEDIMLSAIEFSQQYISKLNDFQKKIQKEIGLEKSVLELKEHDKDFVAKIKSFLSDKIEKAIYVNDKSEREVAMDKLKQEMIDYAIDGIEKDEIEGIKYQAEEIFDNEIDLTVHNNILEKDKRPDGRKLDQVREITCNTSILSQTHGSGLFQRGATQALSVVTLGSPSDEQIIDGMEADEKRRFFHHYNFPPFSVGETGMMRGPGRREIGHGALAERALFPLIPKKEDFPYTIRLVSEILSSNGSSSMASVSGSSLALMDAGVPIKRAVTGIAMGLMTKDNGEYKVITDIQGAEDHHGDMDCKVAGTVNGITACQMDIKVHGVTLEILKDTLKDAKKARLSILEKMNKEIGESKAELSSLAPRILTIQINPDKIGTVIGPGGKVINGIIDETGTKIDIEDDGTVYIISTDKDSGQKALDWVKGLVREAKPGEVFQGKVVKIMDFGAFVEILPGQDGLVHVSEISNEHVRRVEDVLKPGQIISVKVKNIDDNGRISLTMKDVKK
ncbi:polyribonucleotide nucleotidyltransferase [Patescibacteria group bacterium]